MKTFVLHSIFLATLALASLPCRVLASDTLWLPNLGAQATGTSVLGVPSLNTYVTGGNLTFTEQATAANGGLPPALDKVVAGFDGTTVRTLKTDSSGNLQTGRTWSLLDSTDSVSAVQSGTWSVGRTWSLLNSTDSVASVQSGTWNVGRTWNLSSASDTVNAVQSGAWSVSVSNFPATQAISAASLPLPTGAATSANQTTANTSLSSIDAKTPALGQTVKASSQPVVIASDQGNLGVTVSNFPASQAVTGTFWQATQPVSGSVTISSNKAPTNANASNANSTVTTTAATLTAPANAVGFLLQNIGTSTANIRWQIGGVASSSSGVQLAPGQDSGFVPAGSSISIAAESGTQNYSVQWVQQ